MPRKKSRTTVVVFGGANLDIIARPRGRLQPGVSNPGTVHVGAGGAGRNVAANLARLGLSTALVAVVGSDAAADYLIAETAQAGVDVSRMPRLDGRSNFYVAIAGAGPELLAVSDMAAEVLSPEHVEAVADITAQVQMVVVDANLHPRTIAAVVEAAGATPLCLLPTSPAKAARLIGVLEHAALIVTSAAELEVIMGRPIASAEDALDAGLALRRRTGAAVVVSMGAAGVGVIAADTRWLEALPVAVVDVTGAGDAVAAAAIFGRVSGMSAADTVRLARAAGAMTVTTPGATHPALSLQALRTYA